MFPANFEVAFVKQVLETLVAEMLEQNLCLDKALEEFEKQFLQTALRRSGGNQCKAAQLLHIHRNTLARKIVQHKIKATDGSSINRQGTIVAARSELAETVDNGDYTDARSTERAAADADTASADRAGASMVLRCRCPDLNCPVCHRGCLRPAFVKLYRTDLDDEIGTVFCDRCAVAALESGAFTFEYKAKARAARAAAGRGA